MTKYKCWGALFPNLSKASYEVKYVSWHRFIGRMILNLNKLTKYFYKSGSIKAVCHKFKNHRKYERLPYVKNVQLHL